MNIQIIIGAMIFLGVSTITGCIQKKSLSKSTDNISVKSAPIVSGVQLWNNNCMRCHNNRSPASYTDSQWETIGLHMRVRANLTKTEHKEIVKFLQSSN